MRYGLILGLICLLAAGLLAGMNSLTKNRIILQAQAEEQASLKEVVPRAARFEPVKSDKREILYYNGYDQDGKLAAVAFKALAKGYSSPIETMAGMTKDGTIIAIMVLSQNETPGLGARITEKEFGSRFSNKKNLDDVQAISGATISSQAVIDSVKNKAEEIKGLISNAK